MGKGHIEIIPANYEIPDGWKELRSDWLDKAVLLAKAISTDGRKSVFEFESNQMQHLFSELSR